MSGDRPADPYGRRAFFSDLDAASGGRGPGADVAQPGRTGRTSLFSGADRGSRRGGAGGAAAPLRRMAVVECRTCLQRTPVSLGALALHLIPSLWLPARPWPRLMRCPACGRVAWCRIGWQGLLKP